MRRLGLLTPLLAALVGLTACQGAGAAAPLGTPPARLTAVGPGSVESSIRQVARTPEGRVYIAVADDDGGLNDPGDGDKFVRMYRADRTGIPTAFAEVDHEHATLQAQGSLSGADMRLDRGGTIQVAYVRTLDGSVHVRSFSTVSNTWGADESVPEANLGLTGNPVARGRVRIAMALDASDRVWIAAATASGLRIVRRDPGGWTLDATLPTDGHDTLHPALTFDRAGRLHLAWYDDTGPAIRYALRDPSGGWSPPEDVAAGSGVQTNINYDQSPSIAIDLSDAPIVLWQGATPFGGAVRTARRGGDGIWTPDTPDPEVSTHTAAIHVVDDDRYALLGHDAAIHSAYVAHASGSATWSDPHVFASPSGSLAYQYDGSASSRYDPLHDTDCHVIDAVWFDEDRDDKQGFKLPFTYYAAIRLPDRPTCPAGATVTPPPPPLTGPAGRPPALTLRSLRLARTRFKAGDRRATVALILNAAARVRVDVEHAVTARRRTRWIRVRRLSAAGRPGRNVVALGLSLSRKLPAGAYRAAVSARADDGRAAKVQRRSFRLLKR